MSEMNLKKMNISVETEEGLKLNIKMEENKEDGVMSGHPYAYIVLLQRFHLLGLEFANGSKDNEQKETIINSIEQICNATLRQIEYVKRGLNE